MSLVIDEHRRYLADASRIGAFDAAIRATVTPGDVVVDLASGTGILGLLACRAGAGRVYQIESDPIIEVAREIAKANGLADRIVFVNELSTRVRLPERADVLVTDMVGRFGFEAGLFQYLPDAQARFLRPGGTTIPSRICLWAAPIEVPELRGQIDFWRAPVAGFDMTAAYAGALSTGYPRALDTRQLLGPAATLVSLDVSAAASSAGAFRGEMWSTIDRPGTLDAVGGWFSAKLSPGIEMTNAPGAPQRIDRRNVCLPIATPVPVEPGQRIRTSVRIRPAETLLVWDVDVHDAAGVRLHHFRASTFRGMLLSREQLQRMRPEWVPQLTPAGVARRSVLELCDGVRELIDIERELERRHPQLFGATGDAAAFVAEVVTRYAN